jgi:hypothetical protein
MLILLLLIALLIQTGPGNVADGSFLTVLKYKWTKTRISVKKAEAGGVTPARAVIPQNKTFARNVRINEPAGVRDPNADTLDGRSAEMDRMVRESRNPKTDLDGFTYEAKVRNESNKVIEIVFWEYQFAEAANPENLARRQFLCGVDIRPGKEKDLEGFSLSGPAEVVSVETLADKKGKEYQDRALINRIEYSDGSIWQRPGWHLNEVKHAYDRVIKEPWTPGTCKAL